MIGALAVAPASANAAYWVGLGDSFAAGPLIPNQTLSPLGCLRSTKNYARLASAQLGVSLKDASCSGAETAEMTTPQSTYAGTNPPQLDVDRRRHAGGLAVRSAATTSASPRSSPNCQTANPFGRPCQDKYVRGGVDELRNRIAATAPKVAAVLDGHPGRTTAARILVLNYEAILPSSGSGCWPQVPFAWADVPYVRGIQLELNKMIASQARGRGDVSSSTSTRVEPRQGRVQGLGHALGRAAGAGQRRGAVPPQCPWHGGSDAGGRRRGSLAALRSLDAAARTLLRADLAPSASQRTHFWPSAVHTIPKCIGLPSDVPLLRMSQVPSARLE